MSDLTLDETELRVLRSCERWQAGDFDGRADLLEGIDWRLVFSCCSKLRQLGLIGRCDDFFAGPLSDAGRARLASASTVAS